MMNVTAPLGALRRPATKPFTGTVNLTVSPSAPPQPAKPAEAPKKSFWGRLKDGFKEAGKILWDGVKAAATVAWDIIKAQAKNTLDYFLSKGVEWLTGKASEGQAKVLTEIDKLFEEKKEEGEG